MSQKTLLLHACCGPCAIMPILRLQDEGYKIILWYMNPNIQPLSEYLRRREALLECAERLGVEALCADESWDLPAWLAEQLPRAQTKERCEWCCGSRLEAVSKKAVELGLAVFSSSLLYSRYQPHDVIAAKGYTLEKALGLEFIYRDFRVDWQKGIELSKDWGIYRQPYCGCIFSESERYAKKLEKAKKESGSKKLDN